MVSFINQGFFLTDGGYYFGISDKVDLAVRGDIYSKGSWGAKVIGIIIFALQIQW